MLEAAYTSNVAVPAVAENRKMARYKKRVKEQLSIDDAENKTDDVDCEHMRTVAHVGFIKSVTVAWAKERLHLHLNVAECGVFWAKILRSTKTATTARPSLSAQGCRSPRFLSTST